MVIYFSFLVLLFHWEKSQNDYILHPLSVFNTLTFQYPPYTGTNVYFICKNNVQKSERIATIFHPILIVLVHMCLIVVVVMLHIRCIIKMVIIIMYFLCFLSTNFWFLVQNNNNYIWVNATNNSSTNCTNISAQSHGKLCWEMVIDF